MTVVNLGFFVDYLFPLAIVRVTTKGDWVTVNIYRIRATAHMMATEKPFYNSTRNGKAFIKRTISAKT